MAHMLSEILISWHSSSSAMCGWISFNGLRVTSKYITIAYSLLCTCMVGRDSSVGIALATGWAVRGSNPGGVEIFRTCPNRPWGPLSLLYNGYRVFSGGKAGGAWPWPPTPFSTEVKGRVMLYFYSPSKPSWPVPGWTLPLPALVWFHVEPVDWPLFHLPLLCCVYHKQEYWCCCWQQFSWSDFAKLLLHVPGGAVDVI